MNAANSDKLVLAKQANQGVFKFVGDNFAAFSAISSAVAASLSIIFIFGYLDTFDASLIMILEYSDILKFILIGICICFGLIAIFFNVINVGIQTIKYWNSTAQKVGLIIVLFLVVVLPLILAWRANSPELHYYTLRAISVILALGLLFFALRPPEYFVDLKAINILGIIVMLYLFVYLVGRTFGLYVDTDGTPHQIIVRETPSTTRVLADAKLVLFTSHHVIIKVQSEISVFQTADVLEVTSPSKDWMPLFPFQ